MSSARKLYLHLLSGGLLKRKKNVKKKRHNKRKYMNHVNPTKKWLQV